MIRRHTALLIVILTFTLLLPADAGATFSVPNGFDDELVVGGIDRPTSIDWLPDGELLVTSQEGTLYRSDGPGLKQEVLDLTGTVCLGSETGLLGLAVDPNFDDGQRFVYLYYTDRQGGGGCGADNRANRVSRFTVAADETININSEQVLIDNISARGGNHNGGDLQFGKDGLLYVSVGDAGQDLVSGDGQDNNRNARRLSLLNGKILRIEPDGRIPDDNPFTGNDTRRCGSSSGAASAGQQVKAEKKNRKHKHKNKNKNRKKQRRIKRKRRQLNNADTCQEIFATGLRNPFRIAFDPDDGPNNQRFYINDVGGGAWEEIDEGQAGADYGWNVREGPCPTGESNCNFGGGGFEAPIFAYRTGAEGCRTLTGGAFVPNDSGWAGFEEAYLYADLACNTIFALREDDHGDFGELPEEFGTGSGAVHLRFHPNGTDLFYTTFENGGEVRRIFRP